MGGCRVQGEYFPGRSGRRVERTFLLVAESFMQAGMRGGTTRNGST